MPEMMTFQSIQGNTKELTRITLPAGFDATIWGQLERYYREKIGEGHLKWELDLTQLQFFSSTMLGLAIGFNTIVATRNGSLRLIVAKNSSLAQLMKISKVDRILNVEEKEC